MQKCKNAEIKYKQKSKENNAAFEKPKRECHYSMNFTYY